MKSSFFLAILLLLVSCRSKNEYTIQGSFTGEQSEEWIYLVKFMEYPPRIDSAKIENGEFQFCGSIDFPEVYCLSYPMKKVKGIFPFFLEASNLKLVIDVDNWAKGSSVSNGPINDEYQAMEKRWFVNYEEKIQKLEEKQLRATGVAQKKINRQIDELLSEESKDKFDFITNNPESPISIYLLCISFYNLPLDQLRTIIPKFSLNIQKTFLFQMILADYKNQIKLQNLKSPSFHNGKHINT